MKKDYKFQKGDEVRIIAPSRSLSIIDRHNILKAQYKLESLGFTVTYSNNVYEKNEFSSSTIKSRVDDIHNAYIDTNVKVILTAIGGHNVNQILDHLDYLLIKENPKVLCGYSDITALLNAIYTKTGNVQYLGPHFSTFAMEKGNEYTIKSFIEVINQNDELEIKPSKFWSDDAWYLNQETRKFKNNEGWISYNKGEATGICIGGNIGTFRLLQGTQYMPTPESIILLIEDDELTYKEQFDRDLQSLIHLDQFKRVKGIIIGRFQSKSNITQENIARIIKTKKELEKIPIITNVNIGHMTPLATFPIGGALKMAIEKRKSKIIICK